MQGQRQSDTGARGKRFRQSGGVCVQGLVYLYMTIGCEKDGTGAFRCRVMSPPELSETKPRMQLGKKRVGRETKYLDRRCRPVSTGGQKRAVAGDPRKYEQCLEQKERQRQRHKGIWSNSRSATRGFGIKTGDWENKVFDAKTGAKVCGSFDRKPRPGDPGTGPLPLPARDTSSVARWVCVASKRAGFAGGRSCLL